MSAAVSFVIPHWNRSDLLQSVIRSIRAQTVPALEILVVDNGSADGSQQVAEQAGAKILQLDRNRGFSFAVNRGVEAARGAMVAVVNNDVEFAPDWTEKLARRLEQSGGWFAIGKILDYSERERIDGAGDAICRGGTACRLGHGRPDGSLFDTPRATFFPTATAILMRREFLERAGGFDEVFFAYLEDVDLGIRAALLGLEGVYSPDAVAYHRGSATLGAWSPQMVQWLTRNQVLLLAKFYPWALIGRFWRSIVVAQGLWAAMALRHGRGLSHLSGLLAGLTQSRELRRSASRWRAPGNQLAKTLLRSEAELALIQRGAGWDHY